MMNCKESVIPLYLVQIYVFAVCFWYNSFKNSMSHFFNTGLSIGKVPKVWACIRRSHINKFSSTTALPCKYLYATLIKFPPCLMLICFYNNHEHSGPE